VKKVIAPIIRDERHYVRNCLRMKVSGLKFMVAPPPVVSLGVTVH